MGLGRFLIYFLVFVGFVVSAVWICYPKDRPNLTQNIFRGLLGGIIMVAGMALFLSGIFYEPKSLAEDLVMTVVVLLGLSALSAAIFVVAWRKVRP